MRSTRPLDRFPLVHTQNAEEMCAALAMIYAKPKLSLEGRSNEGDATLNYCLMKDIGLGYSKYGIGARLAYRESDFTLQTFPLRGRGEATLNDLAIQVGPGRGMTVSAGTSYSVKYNAGYEHLVLVLDTSVLTDKLIALTGRSASRPLRFHATGDEARPAAKSLRDHFLFLVETMSTSAAPLAKWVLAEFEQTLMVMFLHANRHNYSHLLEDAPADSAPRQVRRAEAYIEANWHRAVILEDLAEVSGVSALALLRSFKKSRGYSPTELLNRVRLDHARELLRHSDAATVAGVAATCGFADLARFENVYSLAFGERPSETLRRGAGAKPAGF